MRLFVFILAGLLVCPGSADAAAVLVPIVSALATAVAGSVTATAVGAFLVKTAITVAFGLLAQSLQGKPGGSSPGAASPLTPQDRTRTIRQSLVERDIPIGYVNKGGFISFRKTSGGAKNSKYRHLVVTLAGAPCEAINGFQIGDELISMDMIDPDGMVNSGLYDGLVKLQWDLGTQDQPFPDLVAEDIGWLDTHRQKDCVKFYGRFEWENDVFANDIPNISVYLKGILMLDDRDSVVRFSDNAGMGVLHYMRLPEADGGMETNPDYISNADALATINLCDEIQVTAQTPEVTFDVESVDVAGDWMDSEGHLLKVQDGDQVQISTTGTLPGNLAALTDYYVISYRARENPVRANFGTTRRAPALKLASSLANSRAGIAIDLLNAGTGIHTIVKTGEPRYGVSGVITLSDGSTEESVLSALLTAMGGSASNTGGDWNVSAASFVPSSLDLTLKDIYDGGIRIIGKQPLNKQLNTVHGTYNSPINYDKPQPFPQYQSAIALAEDGSEKKTRIDRPFTARPHACQRLSKIEVERQRQQIVVEVTTSMVGLAVRPGSTITFTEPLYGWDHKEFMVTNWALSIKGEPAALTVKMTWQETAAAVFDWNSGEESPFDVAPNTNLPGAGDLPDAPQNLTLASGNNQILTDLDGTVIPRILVSWDQAVDDNVLRGGFVFVEFKNATVADWESSPALSGGVTEMFVYGARSGDLYDIQVRFVNVLGRSSPYASEFDHTVLGKSDPASDPTGFGAQQNGNVVVFGWNPNKDLDHSGSDIRFDMKGATSFEDATPLTEVTKGTQITTAKVPPGDWTFFLSHADTSGNFSTNAQTVDLLVVNEFDVIQTRQDAPRWPGVMSGLLQHYTGVLVLDSTVLASDMTDAELWDTANAFPVASGSYEMSEFDLFVDGTARVWGSVVSNLAPGEVTGDAAPQFQIDYRPSAGAYDGYENWSVGTIGARYVKGRMVVDSSVGIPVVSGFEMTADSEERVDVQSVTVPVGGTSVVHSPAFRLLPAVTDSPADGLIPVRTNETVNGYDLILKDTIGVAHAGTSTSTATGL